MTNLWKRSLSMFLVIVMLVGMLPVNAFATENDANTGEPEAPSTEVVATTTSEQVPDETPTMDPQDLGAETPVEPEDPSAESGSEEEIAIIDVDVIDTADELKTALEKNGEVKLGGNIVVTGPIIIPQGVTVTLDLNGYTVSSDSVTEKYAFNNQGTLTLKDSVGTGAVNARGIYNGYVNSGDNNPAAKLIVESGTYNAMGPNGGAAIFNYGVVEVKGGAFTSIGGYSLNNQAGASMTIDSGVTANNGIYASGATVTVNGGEISGNRSGYHVVYAWNSTLTINGGNFFNNNSGNATIMAAGTTQATINGGTFGIKDGRVPGNGNTWTSCLTDTANTATMTVTGGTFNGGFRVQAGTTMNIQGGSFNDVGGSNYNIYGAVTVNGGKFTDDTAKSFATKYVEEDFVLKADGTVAEKEYPVKIGDKGYETLQAAIDAAQNGATIVFNENIEQADGVIITDKQLTIDLNGKTFKVTEGKSTNNRNIKINGTSVVTVKNGTMIAAGDYSSGAYGTIRTEGSANVTLTGLKLYNYRGNGLNIKALGGTTVSISDTEIYSEYGGGIESAGGTIELTNVTVEQKGMYTAPYNSMAISVNGGGKVTVNSGIYTTECLSAEDANNQGSSHGSWAVGVLNSGGTLIIKGGTFANGNFGEDSLATAARGLILADTGAVIQIKGGTFNALKGIVDIQNNLGDASKNPTGVITGGTFSADPTNDYVKIEEGFQIKANDDGTFGVAEIPPVAQIGTKGYATLQAAVDAVKNGETITLVADVAENVKLTEKVGLYYTIDGNGKKMNGSITITPLSDTNDNRRITIQNVNFVNNADTGVDFISSAATNHYPRITVEGCSFTGNGKATDVAVRLKSSHSVVIKNCTGTGLHSFLQNTSGWNLTVENVNVSDSKSGLALGTVQGVTVKGCDIDVDGYGIRMDAQYNNNAVIENNAVEAFIPVVVRKAAVKSTVTFQGTNTMTATNTDGLWCAIGTSEYEENNKMPTAATGSVKVFLQGTGLNEDGVYGQEVPKGNNFTGYTRNDGIWGEVWGNAYESFVIKVLDKDGNVMGTTALNNVGGIINGNVNVTWSLKLDAASNTDEYWTMKWDTEPTLTNMPAAVELWVDGVPVSEGNVVLNGPDNIDVIKTAEVDANGKILSFNTNLQKAVEAVADGGTIVLLDNITVDNKTRVPNGTDWYDGIGYYGDKSFTIDLNGKTFTQNGSVNDYLMFFKNNGSKANTITIKNGTLDAGTTAYCALCTSSSNAHQITINLEKVNLIGNNSNGAVAKIRGGAELNVKAGTVITGKNNYVGIEAVGTNTVVNICEGAEIYQQGTGSYVGSLVGVSGNATVNVSGGSGTSAQGGFIAMTSGGTINISGGEWIANNDGTYANSNKSVLIAQSEKGAKSVVNVTGGTFKGGYNCYGAAVGDAQINISGGNFNANPSAYVEDGYVAVAGSNGTFDVKVAVAKVGTTYYATLQDAFKAAKANDVIVLQQDVTISENWDARFTGAKFTVPVTIDGNGKTIKFTSTVDDKNYFAAFRFEADATVKNLTVDMSECTSARVRAISAKGNLTVDNCTFIGNGATNNNRAIIFGEGAGANVGNLSVSVTNSTFTNWKRGLGDNENAQNVKSVTATGNTFENAGVNVSASEEVVFTGNTVSGKEVIITSYKDIIDNVTVTDNTLENATGTISNVKNYENVQDNFTKVAPVVLTSGNETKYFSTLADALTAAKHGDTIELMGNAAIAMNGSVFGKTVTITGTAKVDWSKGFLFVGRGGEGDGKVIFDNAHLTSVSNNASYGIHVSGREKNTNNKYNGTLEIKDSTIELDFLINKGTMTLDNATLTVKNGFAVGGRPASETESGEDATATLTLNNGSKLVVNNHNGMGLGYEAIGIMNVNSGSTFECTQNFLVTAKGTMNVNGGTVKVAGTLTNNGNVNITDATVELAKLDNDYLMYLNGTNTFRVEDASGSSYAIRANDGVVMNNSYVKGTANETFRLLGSATFNGGFECAYLQGSSAGIGGTVTIAEGTTVKATYGVEFSKDYKLNGGTIKLSGGNAAGKIWGCVFQSAKFEINTDIVIEGNGATAPIHFTNATAVINSNISQSNPGGEVVYLRNSDVTVNKGASITSSTGVHVNDDATLKSAGNIKGNIKKNDDDAVIEITGGTYTMDVKDWCVDGFVCESNGDGTYTVRQLKHLIINVTPVATMALDETIINVATMDEAVAAALAANADYVTYKISGPLELTTGFEHGIVNLGKNVIIEGVTENAKLTIVGGGVPDIQGVTFKNITLADEGTYLPNNNEFMYQNYIDCTFIGCTFEEGIRVSGNTTLENCTINQTKGNQYALWADGGKVTMTGSTVVVDGEGYGMVKSDAATEYVLTGNTFEYKNDANKEVLNTKDAKITASDNKFIDCTQGILPEDKTNYAADGTTELTNEAIVNGNEVIVNVAMIGENRYQTLEAAVAAAQAGNEIKIIAAGTYKVPSGKNITITGAVDGVVFDDIGAHNMGGASMTFNKVTFNYAANSMYMGLQHSGNLEYNDCIINGQVFLYGQSETFNNCTFNNSGDNYNVWTYGAKEVEFNNCKFNSDGKSVLVYTEDANHSIKVDVIDSTFTASAPVDGKAAIEIDTSLSAGAEISVENSTATNFGTGNVSGNSLWNNKKGNNTDANNDITITVDGTEALAPVTFVAQIGDKKYADLHEAMVATKAGETLTLLTDVDLAGTEWAPVSFKGTFDGQNHTISNLTINKPGVSNTGFITSLNGTFQNVTFVNPTVTGGENTGVVAGRAGGGAALAKNITVTGTIKVETTHSGYARAGVIVGGWAYGKYENITVNGINAANSYIKHTGGGDGRYVGGIVGHADDVSAYTNCTVKNITISGGWLCGAIAGPGPASTVTSGCAVENVTMDADYSGGMFGWYFGDGEIKDSSIKDVTFTKPTNNGAIGGYSDNPDATISNVTIENVKNADNSPLLNDYAQIGATYYPSVEAAFAAAQNGDEVKILKAGTYKVPSGKNITITGAVDGVVFDDIGAHNMGGASMTFNKVTFNYAANSMYMGLQHSGNLEYNDCIINGQVFLYGQSETFNNCTFNNSGDNYNVWTYGAKEVEFNNCKFNSDGKSVLVYTEDANHSIKVDVIDSTFTASAPVDGKAAIEIDTSLSAGAEISVENSTATNFGTGNVSGNSLWNNKKGNNTDANNDITITVDGAEKLAPVTFVAKIGEIGYTKIADAIKAANAGETVTILAGNYTESLNVNKAITVVGETDDAGNKLVTFNGKLNITANGATVQNLKVHNSGTACYVNAKDVLIENCELVGSNGLYQSYTTGTVTFKDSTITGAAYGIHFDGKAGGNIVIDNCKVTGWTSFAKTINKVTISDTEFLNGNYNQLRFYQDAELTNVVFNPEMNVDFAKTGISAKFTGCTVTDGSDVIELLNSDDACGQNDIVIDGDSVSYVAKIGSVYYESLEAALANVTDWTTIKLVADATLDYGAREAYGRDTTTDIIIDGQGFTLTLNQTNSDWSSVGMKNADGKLTLKNMTIEKTGHGDTSGAWNKHAIIFDCNVEMTDVTVNNAIAVKNGATLNNVTITEANDFYALWINGNGQKVTVNGGAINGGRGIKIADQYISDPASVELTVAGTKFTTAKKAAVLVSSTAGAKIAASNVDITGVVADPINFVWVDEDWAANYNKVTVTGGTVAQEGIEDFAAAIVDENDAVIGYYADLQAAVDACGEGTTTVKMLADSSKDVTIWQKTGINIIIDGAGKNYSGTMYINGNSNYGSETLTIQNVQFETNEADHDFIWSDSQVAPERYAHNVTVKDCHFSATGAAKNTAVAMRFRQARNITVDGCSAFGLHSMMQVTSSSNVLVDNAFIVTCKNGVSFSQSDKVTVKNTYIKSVGAAGYGIRGEGYEGYTLNVESCDVSAYIPVLIRNTTGKNFTLNVEGDNALRATNDDGYWAVFSKGKVDENNAPVAPEVDFNLNVTDPDLDILLVYPQNLKGSGTEEDPYQITNAKELVWFRDQVNKGNTYAGEYVKLMANIDMTGLDWAVNIGDDCNATFDGTFDGNDKIISNLTSTETAAKADGYICTGLFGAIHGNAVIKNLTIDGAVINTGSFVGNNASVVVGFAYSCTGSIENVKVVNSTINAKDVTGTGAIVGYVYGGKLEVTKCSVEKTHITGAAYVGGIVGYADGAMVITDCSVKDCEIDATSCAAGGIAGILLAGGEIDNAQISNVVLTARHTNWQNSAAAAVGTTTGTITVEATVENVTANGAAAPIVGSEHKKHPTTPVAKVAARIGNTYYLTFAGALAAAEANDTITLLDKLEANVELSKSIALDLNGNDVTGEFKLMDADVTLTGPKSLTVTTDIAESKVVYVDGAHIVKTKVYVAEVNGEKFESLQAAINAANAGGTVTLIGAVKEDVSITKNLTIDGADKLYKYSGMMTVTGKANVTVQNLHVFEGQIYVNGDTNGIYTIKNCIFDGNNAIVDDYAVEMLKTKQIIIENCEVRNYSDWGFLEVPRSNNKISIKNVTVENVNCGMKIDYSNNVYMEDVVIHAEEYGIYNSNFADRTYTLKNCTIVAKNAIAINERGKSGVATFNFVGDNTASELMNNQYAKYVLAEENATLTASEDVNVTTNVAGKAVVYRVDKHQLVTPVAEVDGEVYGSIQEAINAADHEAVITVINNIDIAKVKPSKLDGSYNTYALVEGKTVTIDLNGYTISGKYTDSTMLVGVFSTDNGGCLTLTGNGTVDITGDNVYALIANYEDGCYITIKNGTYTLEKAIDSLMYTGGDDGVIVDGGTFTLGNVGVGQNGKPWIFNALGKNTYNAVVNGGTFNADINHQFWANEVYVPAEKALVNNGDGTWTIDNAVASVTEIGTSQGSVVRQVGYATLAEAFAAAKDGDTITLLDDIAQNKMITNTKKVTLNLNGKTIIGTDNTSKNFSLIDNRGELTITGNGKMTLTATVNTGWSRYSAVIANNPGGKLVVENGTIEHLGGTDMAYGIDNLTNGKGTYAETVINGGTVKSTYRAIRQFLNGVEAQNILTVNGGTIEGANKSIWMQDPSKNANSGKLTVGENANLKGDVYLSVTAGSTEWPVDVSVAAAALKDGAQFTSSNVPEGYVVLLLNGNWTVKKGIMTVDGVPYESWADALADFNDGVASIVLYKDVEYIDNSNTTQTRFPANSNITIDLNGFDLSIKGTVTIASGSNLNVIGTGNMTMLHKGWPLVMANNNNIMIADTVNFEGAIQMNNYAKSNYYYGSDCVFGVSEKAIFQTTGDSNYVVVKFVNGVMDLTLDAGHLTLTKDLETIAQQKVTINVGSVDKAPSILTIPANVTLTLNAETEVINNGTVNGEGTLAVASLEHLELALKSDVKNIKLYADVTVEGDYTADAAENFIVDTGVTLTLKGQMTVTGDVVNNGAIVLADTAATLTAPDGLTVTTDIAEHKVVYENGMYKVAEIIYVAKIGETRYEYIDEAVAAVKSGETIVLLADCAAENIIILYPGVTLDLNGHKLTANAAVGFNGSNIIDGDANKTGRLNVNKNTFSVSKTNSQMPVWTSEGYAFAAIRAQIQKDSVTKEYTKIRFKPTFGTIINNQFSDGAADNGIEIKVRVSWYDTVNGLTKYQDFVYSDDLIQKAYAIKNQALSLVLTGMENFSNIELDIIIESETGVIVEQDVVTIP